MISGTSDESSHQKRLTGTSIFMECTLTACILLYVTICTYVVYRMQSPTLSSDESEEELEVQTWRVERFHKERFLEERRKQLQVLF